MNLEDLGKTSASKNSSQSKFAASANADLDAILPVFLDELISFVWEN